jgi:hypothetical protein
MGQNDEVQLRRELMFGLKFIQNAKLILILEGVLFSLSNQIGEGTGSE